MGGPVIDFSFWEEDMGICIPPLCFAAVAIIFVQYLHGSICSLPQGVDIDVRRLDTLGDQVRAGARMFLVTQYKYQMIFTTLCAGALVAMYSFIPSNPDNTNSETDGARMGGAFIAGSLLSMLAGWIGMNVATEASTRVAVDCATGTLNSGLQVCLKGGAAMGFAVAGLGLAGLSGMFWVLSLDRSHTEVTDYMIAFGAGGSAVALLTRLAGGIYWKACDIGAQCIGRIEVGVDETDARNPAMIADAVGENVGRVAGGGADLFESYTTAIISAMILSSSTATATSNTRSLLICYPLLISCCGILSAIFANCFITTNEDGVGASVRELMKAFYKGMVASTCAFLLLAGILTYLVFGEDEFGWRLYCCVVLGHLCGSFMGSASDYFTSHDYRPTESVLERGNTGPGPIVIQALGVGTISTCVYAGMVFGLILGVTEIVGETKMYYGVAMAAVGMLGTLPTTITFEALGAVADNAGGLGVMANLGVDVQRRTYALDIVGNNAGSASKGFAMGSSVLTGIALTGCLELKIGASAGGSIPLINAYVTAGALAGCMLPLMLVGLSLVSVNKCVCVVIREVQRQFREIPRLHQAIWTSSRGESVPEHLDAEPDVETAIALFTTFSVRESFAPVVLVLAFPLTLGLAIGPQCLMGFLMASVFVGSMLAVALINTGACLDNSKRLADKLHIVKSDHGAAAAIGDRVGAALKDCSGPFVNIVVKLMPMLGLLVAPLLRNGSPDAYVTHHAYEDWHWGMIPLGCMVFFGVVLHWIGVLAWGVEEEPRMLSPPVSEDEGKTQPASPQKTPQGFQSVYG